LFRNTAYRWSMANRSEASRLSILDATLRLLADENMTMKSLSIEAIAKEAGVGKTTIYRWWPSKAAVVIDAFMENHLVHTPVLTDVPVREALASHLRSLIHQYAGVPGRLVSQILAESQYDPEIRAMFRERFFDDRYWTIIELVQRGVDNGELSPSLDPRLLTEMLYAPVYHRLLIGHRPLDDQLADELIATALELGAATPDTRARTTRRRAA
jgi:AcrR family transcriptional regulator